MSLYWVILFFHVLFRVIRVSTDMTNHTGLIDVKTSVAGLTKVIGDVDNYDPGTFVAFDGQVIPF